jgi:RNA polymerase sigma-70 factor (ECF subfamily)
MKLKDKNILNKIRRGDIYAFETLFHRFYPGMCHYAKSLVKKDDISEEIVQDVFYNIWKNRVNFRLTSGWQNYLYRAVYNNSLKFIKKSKREIRMDDHHIYDSNNKVLDPSEELLYSELTENIDEVLERLPERTRQIFLMNRFDGFTYREIAEKLSISIKTVEANMGKALRIFRTSLEHLGYENKK